MGNIVNMRDKVMVQRTKWIAFRKYVSLKSNLNFINKENGRYNRQCDRIVSYNAPLSLNN